MNTQGLTSADVAALLQTAVAAHQGGALDDAARQYERILAIAPDHARTLYLAGAVALQREQYGRARELLARSLKLEPDNAFAAEALGAVALHLSDPALAVQCFERVYAVRPEPQVRANLARALAAHGRVVYAQGSRVEAEQICRRARGLNPQDADAAYILANALRGQGRFAEAADAYGDVVALQPDSAPAFDEYGGVLFELKRLAEAERTIRQSIALAPQAANAYTNLGRLYFPDPAKAAWALELHDKAIALQPDHPEAHSNRGTALYLLGRYEDAAESHRKAIALRPTLAEAHNNQGNDLFKLGDVDGALACYRAATAQAPDYAEGHYNEALALLTVGRLAEGFREYEWRWKLASFAANTRPFPQPWWTGQQTADTLLVWGEQGVGDEIFYGAMAADLAAANRPLAWEMDARLVPLVARTYPQVKAVPRRSPPDRAALAPDIGAQMPLASLGQYLRPEAGTFPTLRNAFLRADAERTARYRAQLHPGAGKRLIGISWISRNEEIGHDKSLTLATLAPVLKMAGVTFVDLQYGDTAAERAAVEEALGVKIHHLPDLDLFADLDGLAALIAACDLVVSVSNTTVHLAGALGVPVWVLIPGGNGKLWYWGQSGETTPWYPSARLFRQSTRSDWNAVMAAVAARLGSP